MIKRILSFVLVLAAVLPMSGQVLLAQLDGNHVDGWQYINWSGVEINAQSIALRRLALFTTQQGNVTELVSPALECGAYDSLRIELRINTFSMTYDASRLRMTVVLQDAEGQPRAQTTIDVPEGDLEHNLTAIMAIDDAPDGCRLHMTAPMADVNNCAAVMRMRIYGMESQTVDPGLLGDVNNDGKIDIDDLNILINIILLKENAEDYGSRALLTDDDKVDVQDVNLWLNIMLNKGGVVAQ